ncbi:MAG: glycosyltransferase family 1 protein [Verrucomicrobiaceae bacterium]|nr:MAG: glycosyltransferase family 1 protein [Verrucomicrobiaceae bacterium]
MRATFYLPEKYLPDGPGRDAWRSGAIRNLEESGKIACAQCWIYQTWIALSAAGIPSELSSEVPKEGILLALSGFFNDSWRPPKGVFFADIVADYLPHPSARLHILQNKAHTRRLPHSVFMPLWTQPNLVARDPARGGVFENICFLGDPGNLAPELRSKEWAAALEKDFGLRLDIRQADRWHDYSDVDCVLAIRDFTKSRQLHKPATKLYNAWLAGVPFIGGRDSAYASDGRCGVDYLRADSPEQLLSHLRRLKEDPEFRMRLVDEGARAGAGFTREMTLRRWEGLVSETLPAAARKYAAASKIQRALSNAAHRVVVGVDRRLR